MTKTSRPASKTKPNTEKKKTETKTKVVAEKKITSTKQPQSKPSSSKSKEQTKVSNLPLPTGPKVDEFLKRLQTIKKVNEYPMVIGLMWDKTDTKGKILDLCAERWEGCYQKNGYGVWDWGSRKKVNNKGCVTHTAKSLNSAGEVIIQDDPIEIISWKTRPENGKYKVAIWSSESVDKTDLPYSIGLMIEGQFISLVEGNNSEVSFGNGYKQRGMVHCFDIEDGILVKSRSLHNVSFPDDIFGDGETEDSF
jgi:hypothetical protein